MCIEGMCGGDLPAVLVATNSFPVALADRAVAEDEVAARFVPTVMVVFLDTNAYLAPDYATHLLIDTHLEPRRHHRLRSRRDKSLGATYSGTEFMSRSRSKDLVAVFAVGCKSETSSAGFSCMLSSTPADAAIAAVPHARIKRNAVNVRTDFIIKCRKNTISQRVRAC